MNCDVTLKADEFKQLHNGLWELDCMVEKLVNGNVYEGQKLATIAKTLRDSLVSAYEQDNRAFERKHDLYDSVRKDLGLRAFWSIYEVNDLSDRHPFEGADRVVYKDHWGQEPVSISVNGLTWAALYVAADAAIRDSGDDHHVFIERFTPSKEDPRTLLLSTGS